MAEAIINNLIKLILDVILKNIKLYNNCRVLKNFILKYHCLLLFTILNAICLYENVMPTRNCIYSD